MSPGELSMNQSDSTDATMPAPSRWRQALLDPRNAAANTALAMIFAVLWVVAVFVAYRSGWHPVTPLDPVVVGLLSALAILLCRPLPLVGLVLVGILTAWPLWWFQEMELRIIPLAVAAYLSSESGLRLRYAAPLVVLFTAATVTGVFQMMLVGASLLEALQAWTYSDPSTRILSGIVVVAALLLGTMGQARSRALAVLRSRNEELARLRHADAARIAAEERTAIARDIHDVVAHHVSAMVIRAQAADRVADTRPDDLRDAVRWIAANGQDALTSMRQVVRVLRADDKNAKEIGFEEALSTVLDRVRGVGLDVTVALDPQLRLTPAAETVLLRVAQESLTNVMLHSDAGRVTLTLAADEHGATMTIDDNGHPVEEPAERHRSGFGIAGMRERAESFGGSVAAGPRDDGSGWRVAVSLPLGPSPQLTTTAREGS